MKNKGFILQAEYEFKAADFDETDLHVCDENAGRIAPDDDSTNIVSIWISGAERYLQFTRSQAKDLMTAMGVIVDRYEVTPEEWEARNA